MNTPLLKNPNCSGMPGISNIKYIDNADVINTQLTADGVKLSLRENTSPAIIEADETKVVSELVQGQAYKHSADITYNGSATSADATLEAMAQHRFLLIYTDNDGVDWLIGTHDNPLRLSYSHENQGEPDAPTAYNLHFEAICECRAARLL